MPETAGLLYSGQGASDSVKEFASCGERWVCEARRAVKALPVRALPKSANRLRRIPQRRHHAFWRTSQGLMAVCTVDVALA